jgi:hypothetical protein
VVQKWSLEDFDICYDKRVKSKRRFRTPMGQSSLLFSSILAPKSNILHKKVEIGGIATLEGSSDNHVSGDVSGRAQSRSVLTRARLSSSLVLNDAHSTGGILGSGGGSH